MNNMVAVQAIISGYVQINVHLCEDTYEAHEKLIKYWGFDPNIKFQRVGWVQNVNNVLSINWHMPIIWEPERSPVIKAFIKETFVKECFGHDLQSKE